MGAALEPTKAPVATAATAASPASVTHQVWSHQWKECLPCTEVKRNGKIVGDDADLAQLCFVMEVRDNEGHWTVGKLPIAATLTIVNKQDLLELQFQGEPQQRSLCPLRLRLSASSFSLEGNEMKGMPLLCSDSESAMHLPHACRRLAFASLLEPSKDWQELECSWGACAQVLQQAYDAHRAYYDKKENERGGDKSTLTSSRSKSTAGTSEFDPDQKSIIVDCNCVGNPSFVTGRSGKRRAPEWKRSHIVPGAVQDAYLWAPVAAAFYCQSPHTWLTCLSQPSNGIFLPRNVEEFFDDEVGSLCLAPSAEEKDHLLLLCKTPAVAAIALALFKGTGDEKEHMSEGVLEFWSGGRKYMSATPVSQADLGTDTDSFWCYLAQGIPAASVESLKQAYTARAAIGVPQQVSTPSGTGSVRLADVPCLVRLVTAAGFQCSREALKLKALRALGFSPLSLLPNGIGKVDGWSDSSSESGWTSSSASASSQQV